MAGMRSRARVSSPSSCQLRETARGQWVPGSTSTEHSRWAKAQGVPPLPERALRVWALMAAVLRRLKRTPSMAASRRPLWKHSGCRAGSARGWSTSDNRLASSSQPKEDLRRLKAASERVTPVSMRTWWAKVPAPASAW